MGEHAHGPHLLNLLGKHGVKATITFGEPVLAIGDRKALGLELHARVVNLYEHTVGVLHGQRSL